ncbi:MAG: hypothetical protein K6A80_05350 [Saccharofermentans sp.]|nr:hypothetical protein [Saccharofermentans sp.]
MSTGYYDELNEKAKTLVKKWEKFDFSSLEQWQSNLEWATFLRAAESYESDSLCLIYSIVEQRMCAYAGRIAVIKGLDDPQLVFASKTASYVEICEPGYSKNGQYAIVQVYTNDFVGALIIDVVNSKYTGIRYPEFEFCTITPVDGDEVLFTNLEGSKKSSVNERVRLSMLNWHSIDSAAVDFIPAFE